MSLNDPKWGRNPEESDEKQSPDAEGGRPENDGREPSKRGGRGPKSEGEFLEDLWKRFSDMVEASDEQRPKRSGASKLKSRDDFSRDDEEAPRPSEPEREFSEPPREPPVSGGGSGRGGMKRIEINFGFPGLPRFGAAAVGIALLIGWGVSGFYIVPEGQSGIVTTFGRYSETTPPGFRWHLPYPIQSAELVDVSSVRTAVIGAQGAADRASEALKLTDDENIVDVQFTVQYRIKPDGAKDYLFRTRGPDLSVRQTAESAMREVVGRKTMDSVLFESNAEIAEDVKKSMQVMLDRYRTGIEVMSVAIQNAQPPQPVQAAFNDAVKAGQDRERSINLGEAYRNAVIPKAKGTASRLKEEAEGYRARVTETARGDAKRFAAVLAEYEKAPQVTRDRLYIDAMRDVFASVSKVYVDQRSGSSLLYLPLEKLVERTKRAGGEAEDLRAKIEAAPAAAEAASSDVPSAAPSATYSTESVDSDTRSLVRRRYRE